MHHDRAITSLVLSLSLHAGGLGTLAWVGSHTTPGIGVPSQLLISQEFALLSAPPETASQGPPTLPPAPIPDVIPQPPEAPPPEPPVLLPDVEEPPPEPEVGLGIEDSKIDSPVWKGSLLPTENLAPKSQVDQAARAIEPSAASSPASRPTPASAAAPPIPPAAPPAELPSPTPPPEVPPPAEPAQPLPLQELPKQELEEQPLPQQPEAQQVLPRQPEPQQMMPQQLQPTQIERAVSISAAPSPIQVPVAQPVPLQPQLQQPLPQQPEPEQPEALQPLPLQEEHKQPDDQQLKPEQPDLPQEQAQPDAKPDTPPVPPVVPPAAPPTQPSPSAPDTPPARGSEGSSDPKPARQTDDESPAASIVGSMVYKPGEPMAGAGLTVRTVPPKYGVTTMLVANPKNATVLVTFGRDGTVIRAVFKDAKGTGYPDVDKPLLEAVYRWKATGEALAKVPITQPPAGITFSIKFLLERTPGR